ncbi:MAG: CopG family transcriptional regulator [Clostridiales bacterium]|nr:CopG family transcriptional regulator [Clostridiales bacterium]
MGRPPIENPKSERLQVRVDKETLATLDRCAQAKQTNRSEILREGIELVREQIDGQ